MRFIVLMCGLAAAVTYIALSTATTKPRATPTAAHKTAVQHKAVARPSAKKCESSRKAVPWYRDATHAWQLKRHAPKLAGPDPFARGHTCGFARHAATEWRARAFVAHKTYTKWLRSFSYRGGNQYVVLGQQMAARYGWHIGYEWEALYELWNHESGWNPYSQNGSSGACGIPQDISSCHGYNAAAQIDWGLRYIRDRWGSPSNALAHWRSSNWY